MEKKYMFVCCHVEYKTFKHRDGSTHDEFLTHPYYSDMYDTLAACEAALQSYISLMKTNQPKFIVGYTEIMPYVKRTRAILRATNYKTVINHD